jgi:hypothetical protein
MQGYHATLINSQGDGTALTNSTTATSILPAQAKYTLGAGFLDVIGKQLMVKARGRISTVVTTPGTLTLDIRLGAVIVATSSAMVLSTSAKTNVTWELEWLLTLRAVGASTTANFMHSGRWTSEAAGATTVAGEAKCILMPTSAPAVGTGFDSTAAQTVDMFATWSVANASNSIQVHQYSLISPN